MAFGPFERWVALRYLRARRKEGFVSVIAGFSLVGIALGVATLIIVMSVMNGFRQELLTRILGLNGHMTAVAYDGRMVDYQPVADEIRGVPGVKVVTPTIEGQVMAASGAQATGAVVRGLTLDSLMARPVIAGNMLGGTLADFHGADVVIVGSRMAQKFGLGVGDKIKLVSPKGTPTAFGTVPRVRNFRIVGTFNVGMYEYDSSFIFMPLEGAQAFFQIPGGITHMEIMVEDPDRLENQGPQIANIVRGRAALYTWQQSNASFFNALQVERNVMFLILTLIILVAALNMISGLIMLVKDKGRDIAILRTMGATRGMVLRIFFLSGASVGVVGTAAGFGLGLLVVDNIEGIRQFLQSLAGTDLFNAEVYFLSKIPAELDWGEVWSVIGMALGLSFGATIYPAWRAAKLDPVEALRYE